MSSANQLLQSADWKKEKHVPVIECAARLAKGEALAVTVSVGKEIAHPNTTEHHIAWINLYFQPQGEKFPYQVGKFEFVAHGASVQGPNTSTVYTHPQAGCVLKTEKSGTLMAISYCNIHGLWESSIEITVS